MKIKVLFLSIFLLLLAFNAWAEPEKLLLKDYLTKITENDTAYQVIFHEKISAQGMLAVVNGIYGIQAFGNYSYAELGDEQFGSFKIKSGKNTNYSLGGSKKFKETGADLSLQFLRNDSTTTYEIDQQDIEVVTNKPSATLRITQPFWQDFMGVLSRMPIERMLLQQDIAVMTEEENEELYYEEAISVYYDWLALTLALDPLKQSYKNAELLLNQVKNQYRNDVALKTDLIRSQEAVLRYQNALEETLYNWNQVGSKIYKKMDRTFVKAENWDDLPVVPSMSAELLNDPSTSKLKKIRTVEIMQKVLKQLKIQTEENKRLALPNLSVYGEVSDYKIAEGNTDSLSNLNSRNTKVGLDFRMFLDNDGIEGAVQQLEETIKKAEEELDNTDKNLRNLYDNYILKINVWQKLGDNARTIAEYSQERLNLETKRYKSGKTMLRDVAEARNQYVQNETDHLNKLIGLAKLKVQAASLNDELLDKVKAEIKGK